jgi:hypothetical protein
VYWICSALDLLGYLPEPTDDVNLGGVGDLPAVSATTTTTATATVLDSSIMNEPEVTVDWQLMRRTVDFLARCANKTPASTAHVEAIRGYCNATRFDHSYATRTQIQLNLDQRQHLIGGMAQFQAMECIRRLWRRSRPIVTSRTYLCFHQCADVCWHALCI